MSKSNHRYRSVTFNDGSRAQVSEERMRTLLSVGMAAPDDLDNETRRALADATPDAIVDRLIRLGSRRGQVNWAGTLPGFREPGAGSVIARIPWRYRRGMQFPV